MLDFIGQQIMFFLALAAALLLPGFWLLTNFIDRGKFSLLERFLLYIASSLLFTDFSMLILSRFDIALSRLHLLLVLLLPLLIFALSYYFLKKYPTKKNGGVAIKLTNKQIALFVLVLFSSILVRSLYLKNYAFPSATDLGHHMFWSEKIALEQKIPPYQKTDIIQTPEKITMGEPQNISDFIIGEHLPFAAIIILSKLSAVSSFPVSVLNLFNLLTLLTIFVLTWRLFEKSPHAYKIALAAFTFASLLFALSPPQAKYVGGGVIGNIIGNFLIAVSIYFLYRMLLSGYSAFILGWLSFSMLIFYTHHLSGLLYILAMLPAVFLITISNGIGKTLRALLNLRNTAIFVFFAIFAALFMLQIHTPSYLANKAVSGVVSEVNKADHEGLPFSSFKFITGEARIALALAFIFLFLLNLKFKPTSKNTATDNSGKILLISWLTMLSIITLAPQLLKLNIPSSRVANYATYPAAMLAALVIFEIFDSLKSQDGRGFVIKKQMFSLLVVLLFSYALLGGNFDNSEQQRLIDTAGADSQINNKAIQLANASQYLAQKIKPDENIIADHVYLTGDAWIKLFFLKDYNFPLFRANFERYENGVDKQENCTLLMISQPSEDLAQKCFNDLNVKYIIVNPKREGSQFIADPSFWPVYQSKDVEIFYRQ